MSVCGPFRTKLDEFAERVAEGATPKQAAQAMGFKDPVQRGNNYMQLLRRKMGAQAV